MTTICKIFAWIIFAIIATFAGTAFVEIFKKYWKKNDVYGKITNILGAVLAFILLLIAALMIGFGL